MKIITLTTLNNRRLSGKCLWLVFLIAYQILSFQVSMAHNGVLRRQDDFEIGAPDETNTMIQEIANGECKGELKYYRLENVTIEKYQDENCLVLNARKQLFSGKSAIPVSVNTPGEVYMQYSKIETHTKLPYTVNGLWPALWLIGSNVDTDSWLQCGEIDIMEFRGQKPIMISGTIHGPGYPGAGGISKSFAFGNSRFDVDFHSFAIGIYHQIKFNSFPVRNRIRTGFKTPSFV